MPIRAKYTSKGEEAASGPQTQIFKTCLLHRVPFIAGRASLGTGHGQALKRLVHFGSLICISASLIELHQPQPANHAASHQCSSRVPHARLGSAPYLSTGSGSSRNHMQIADNSWWSSRLSKLPCSQPANQSAGTSRMARRH